MQNDLIYGKISGLNGINSHFARKKEKIAPPVHIRKGNAHIQGVPQKWGSSNKQFALKSLFDLFTDMGYSAHCSKHLFFFPLFISRKPINGRDCPARSPNLNPCDFFLWGLP